MPDGTLDIATIGLELDARPVAQGDQALKDFNQTAGQTQKAADGVTASTKRMSGAQDAWRQAQALAAAVMRDAVAAANAWQKSLDDAARVEAAAAKAAQAEAAATLAFRQRMWSQQVSEAAKAAADELKAVQAAEMDKQAAWKASQAVQAAAMRDAVAAANAWEKSLAVTAAAEEQSAKTKERLATQIDTIEKRLSPLNAITITYAQTVAKADKALQEGAISQERYNNVVGQSKAIHDQAIANLNKAGDSAKLTGMQMTNLSYQLNDVITGFASGQRPMQIFAQQGGQIVQALQMGPAGLGGSLRAIADGTVSFLAKWGLMIVGVGAFVGVAALAVAEAAKYSDAMKTLENSVAGVGRASNLTAQEINNAAVSGAAASLQSIAAARQEAVAFAAAGVSSAATLRDLISVTEAYAHLTGTDAAGATKALAQALADPVKGLQDLNSAFGGVHESAIRHVQDLVAIGDKQAAANAVAQEYIDKTKASGETQLTLGEQLKKVAEYFGQMAEKIGEASNAWAKFKETFGIAPEVVRALEDYKAAAQHLKDATGASQSQTSNLVAAGEKASSTVASVQELDQFRALQNSLKAANAGSLAAFKSGDATEGFRLQQAAEAYQDTYNRVAPGGVYVNNAQRAHEIADQQVALNRAKQAKDAAGVSAASQNIARLQAGTTVKTNSEIDQAAKDAGRVAGAAVTPSDAAQKAAGVDQAVAQAKANELQAQLAITTDLQARAKLEAGIADAESAAKIAALIKQEEAIRADQGINGALKGRLKFELDQAISSQKSADEFKKLLTAAQSENAIAADRLQIQQQGQGYDGRLLQARLSLAATAQQQNAADVAILALRQQMETASFDEAQAAKARLDAASVTATAENVIAKQAQLAAVTASQYATDKDKAAAQQALDDAKAAAAAATAHQAQDAADKTVLGAKLTAAQLAEQAVQEQKNQLRLINQAADDAKFALDTQALWLGSQQALATTAGKRLAIELQLTDIAGKQALIDLNRQKDAAENANDLWTYYHLLDRIHAQEIDNAARREALLNGAYDNISGALSQAGSDFRSQNWAGGVAKVVDALTLFETQLKQGASQLQQLQGIGGLVAGLGSLIGGTAGKGIAGAGSGIAAGAQLGSIIPGIGTALGAALGGISGLIGGLAGNAAKQTQAAIDAAKAATTAAQAAQGTGTILGDLSAKSDSIAKALDLANSTSTTNLGYASEMTAHLRSIDTSINSVSALLARQLGLSTGGLFDTSGLGIGSSSKSTFGGALGGVAGGIGGGLLGGVAGAALINGALSLGLSGAIGGGLAGLGVALGSILGPIGAGIGLLVGALTKTKVTNTVTDQGLQFSPASVGQISANGISGQTYTDIQSIIKTSLLGIGLSTKEKDTTVFGDLTDQFTKQVTGIVTGIRGTVLDAAKTLGIDGAEATIDAFQVNLGKISLDGLKGDDLTKAISAVFSTFADNLSASLDPIITTLQATGEGAFETLTRLATEYQAVDDILGSMGKTFGLLGVTSIEARDALVQAFGGIDKFASAVSYFTDNFFTGAEKFDINSKQLNQNLGYLADTYGDQSIKSLKTADDFKAYILSIDDTTASGAALEAAMLSLAPAFKAVADYVPDIADAVASLTADQIKWVNDTVQAAVDAAQVQNELAGQHHDAAGRAQTAATAAAQAVTDAAAAFATLSTNVDAAVPALLKTGDVMGALAQRVQQVIANPAYDRHAWTNADGSTNIAGLNADTVRQSAKQAQLLLGQIDAISLSIPNAADAMRGLVDVVNRQWSPEFNQWAAQMGIAGDLLRGVSGGVSAGPGLYAAQDALSFVGKSGYGYDPNSPNYGGETQYYGADVVAYHGQLDALRSSFEKGETSLDAYNASVKQLNDFVGSSFIELANNVQEQLGRIFEAEAAVGRAGAAQIVSVFGQISASVATLDAAAAAANDPIAQVTAGISRLTNEAQLLVDGVQAAVAYGGDTGNASNALLIAQAAGIAASVLTTADASAAAVKLAQSPAFANLTAAGIRDASLLLDGLKANDPQSFTNSLDRIDNALIKGALTQDQYTTLVNTALDTFQGLDDIVSKVTSAFKDLADQLLLDDTVSALSGPQKLAEAQQQYEETLVKAAGGDNDALSALGSITKTYLGLAKDMSSSAADYAIQAGLVQSDLRTFQQPTTANAPRLASENGATTEDIQGLQDEIASLTDLIKTLTDNSTKLVTQGETNQRYGLPTTELT